jgi:hypothetical protein
MADDIFSTADWKDVPKDMSKPLQGPEWEEAHRIVQAMEGTAEFDWVHALLHWIEADMGNADYWYRRAGKKRSAPSVKAEWEVIAQALSGVTKH